jgi:hypothetical protein
MNYSNKSIKEIKRIIEELRIEAVPAGRLDRKQSWIRIVSDYYIIKDIVNSPIPLHDIFVYHVVMLILEYQSVFRYAKCLYQSTPNRYQFTPDRLYEWASSLFVIDDEIKSHFLASQDWNAISQWLLKNVDKELSFNGDLKNRVSELSLLLKE